MAKKKVKPILLVDGSSYLYRAFHALPPLSNSSGQATGAVFGVVNMLRKQIDQLQPDKVGVVFDAKGKTFRHKMYKEYKANRPPMPEELQEQIEPLHAIVKALGLPLLCVSGVEADDVIGTLAAQALENKQPVVISTGDKDLAQLVNDKVTLVNTMSNTSMDSEGVLHKFGVAPDRIIDYLALIGDTSDNVPGVAKVGPKTAVKWLTEYDSVDGIIENAENIKGKVGENLRSSIDQLKLSRDLVTIKCDVDLDITLDQLERQEADTDALKEWYQRLEFRALLEELLEQDKAGSAAASKGKEKAKSKAKSAAIDTSQYEVIVDSKSLDGWIKKLQKAGLFAFDTETTSLDYMQAEIVGVSFALADSAAAYVPVAHDYPGAPDQLGRDAVLQTLKPLLQDSKVIKIGQHIKYDMHVLLRYGIELRGVQYDTMLESYVLDSTGRHDMDTLALKYLNHKTIHFEDIAGKGAKQLTFNQIALDEAAPYAAEDADVTYRLHQKLAAELKHSESLEKVYREIEVPLIPVLMQIEHTGVFIDTAKLEQQSKELTQKLADLEQRAYELAKREFNLGSPKQIQQILFEEQGLPVIKKTPKGQPSTSEEVLQELALDYPLPKVIIEHRGFSKLKSTYVDKLPLQINPDTKRVHTSYHQAVTVTGRLSSSDPNLQNIPIRTEEGRRIRQAFIAAPGHELLAADYSQIELRIMAHLSGDERLMQAFKNGEDVHRATAAEVFGRELDQVSTEQRRSAKAINFGLIYGMSAFGLARQLGIERSDAQGYVDLYFDRYPGVKRYMDDIRKQAHHTGFVETVFGRRLYLPEINSNNAMRRQYAERTAINAPMQGTAADIIKRAMIAVQDWISKEKLGMRMIMQVHDELVLEVPKAEMKLAREAIPDMMQQAAELSVPLLVDVGSGPDWDTAH